jgi:hypothetical protein
MKRAKIVLILLSFIITGCGGITRREETHYRKIDGMEIQILKIDSCEYLYGPWGNATVLTHKGDCSNPIHKGGNDE